MLRAIIILLWVTTLSFSENSQTENYQVACKENNATACYAYALPLVEGENAKVQDIKEKGLSYMRKACLLDEYRGCDILGEEYYNNARYIAAIPYLVKSCQRKVSNACMAMGTIYRDGHDVPIDDVKSRIFYEQSCALDKPDACYSVALIYRAGFGVAKDKAKENAFYERACQLGLDVGCSAFKDLSDEMNGTKVGFWEGVLRIFL